MIYIVRFCRDSVSKYQKERELFDATMGNYDDEEACELVELFILYAFIGLYRDNRLVALNFKCTSMRNLTTLQVL